MRGVGGSLKTVILILMLVGCSPAGSSDPDAVSAPAGPTSPTIADQDVPRPTPPVPTSTGTDVAPHAGSVMPAGGGTQMGTGVDVSAAGRYTFTLVCSGDWKDRAVQVSLTEMPARKPGDSPAAGTFACQQQPLDAQVSIDARTTQRLLARGPQALMLFTVVRLGADRTHYERDGLILHGMSVLLTVIRPQPATST